MPVTWQVEYGAWLSEHGPSLPVVCDVYVLFKHSVSALSNVSFNYTLINDKEIGQVVECNIHRKI
jgi:hypothetical protein